MRMNEGLRKSAKKILLILKVKSRLEKICRFYALLRFEKGLDIFKGECGFYEIIQAGNIVDIKEEFGFEESAAKALEKVVQMVLKEKIMIV